MSRTYIILVSHVNSFLTDMLNYEYNIQNNLPTLDTSQLKTYYKTYSDIISALFSNTTIPFEQAPVNLYSKASELATILNKQAKKKGLKTPKLFDVSAIVETMRNVFTDTIWTNHFADVTYHDTIKQSLSSDGTNILITHATVTDAEYIKQQLTEYDALYTLDIYTMPDRSRTSNAHTISLSQITSKRDITKLVSGFVKYCSNCTKERTQLSTEVDIDIASLVSPVTSEDSSKVFAKLKPVEVTPADLSSTGCIKDVSQTSVGKTNYKLTYSSQTKGVIGEDTLMTLLKSVNIRLDVQKVSSTGHVADIHVIDYDHNIKYIVESKYKQTISRSDVTKFENDLKNIRSTETCYKIVGLFLSLSTDTIVGIGSYSVTPDDVYLTQSFINKETLQVVFDMITINHTIMSSVPHAQTQPTIFEIPKRIYELVAAIRSEYNNLVKEHALYNNILDNTKKTTTDVLELLSRIQIKEEFIKLIDKEFAIAIGQDDPQSTVNSNVTVIEEERLKAFIKEKGKGVTKKLIKESFPTLATTLASMTKKDILHKYGPVEWQK